MAGGFIFCEWNSVKREYPDFQRAFAELEAKVIEKCDVDWAPKKIGYLTPGPNEYGRTSILPEIFKDNAGSQMAHWRQHFSSTGHQTLITGAGTGNVIPEGIKVAWIGLAFPNKQLNITELKWQISDGKFVRVNIEELKSYNKPAIVFEEGYILNEEEAFELMGYVDAVGYQRIVMLGALYYKTIDKVLGNCGAAIT